MDFYDWFENYFGRARRRRPTISCFEIEKLETRAMLTAVPAAAAEQSESPEITVVQNSDGTASTANSSAITENDGIAKIEVSNGNEINAAFIALTDYIHNSATAIEGVVDVTANTTFAETITTRDNIVLNISEGVTLSLVSSLEVDHAIDTSFTTNSGVTGAGTLSINGNARQGIYSVAADSLRIGNVGDSAVDPVKLSITGWQFGVFIVSNAETATRNITIENLEVTQPHTSFVEIPVFISTRPAGNGKWVENVTIDNLLVDGSQPGGVVGAHSAENGFTADQVVLQGVHGGTLSNIVSRNGGENGLDVNSGSRDVVVSNVTIENPDGHAFAIGGGSQALDVESETGFTIGQQIRGVTSGTVADVIGVFEGRIWTNRVAFNRFQVGETIELVEAESAVSTQLTAVFRTENITVENSNTSGAGLNARLDISQATGNLVAYSDIFLQQADGIQINNNVFSSIGRADPAGGLADHFGVNANVADFSLSGNTFVDYGDNQIPVVTNANSTQTAGTPDINTILGTSEADEFTGTNFTDTLFGGQGNDDIRGGGGDDQITGDEGDDVLNGEGGTDTINGGIGDDLIQGGGDNDTLIGGEGSDQIFGQDGDDQIEGGGGDDSLFSGSGDDVLNGGAGVDSLFGGTGNNTISGGDGDDLVLARSGNDTLFGDAGDDQLNGEAGDDSIFGGTGNDLLFGGVGVDHLEGEQGDDRISGEEGDDTLLGGIGLDTLFGGDGNDTLEGGDAADAINGDNGNDTLRGGTGNDTLNGGEGDDTVEGGDGNDRLIGGLGSDSFDGGDGTDYVDFRDSSEGVTVDLLNSANNSGANAVGDTLVNVEDLFGTDFADQLFGDHEDNSLAGEGGNDQLFGREGDDTLNGREGDDLLVGGAGADVLNGGEGNDTVSYADAADGVGIDLNNLASNTGDAAGDTFLAIENYLGSDHDDTFLGNGGVNNFVGGAGDDFLAGNGGSDTLEGGDGNDTLQGGRGGDVLDGGQGADTASYADAPGNVLVFLGESTSNAGIAIGDIFVSIENLTGSAFGDTLGGDAGNNLISGGLGNDRISGGDGNDNLVGGEGADQLTGGTGDDLLTGGDGNDRFIFDSSGWGHDTIVDFANDNLEKIDFRGIEGLHDVDDLTITDTSEGVLLTFDGDSVLLSGHSSSDINRLDFLFDPAVNNVPTTSGTPVNISLQKNGVVAESGTVSFEDLDAEDTHSATVNLISTTHSMQLGELSASIDNESPNQEVAWSYIVDNSTIQFLGEGESVTESYQITISDSQSGNVTVEVVVTITGDAVNKFVINTVGDKADVDLSDGVAKDEDGNTSLRAAIAQANASAAGTVNQLEFDIVDGSGDAFIIQLAAALPAITSLIHIDGSTQGGTGLVLDGSGIESGVFDGLRVQADGVQINDLTLTNFSSDGIEVFRANNVVIDSVVSSDNAGAGIRFNDSTESQISNSVLVGNGTSGVQLIGATANQGNLVSNNLVGIGTDDVAYGNLRFGVQVLSGGNDIFDNVISGNERSGLVISGDRAIDNVVYGNRIGTNFDGTAAVSNQAGILVTRADNNIIGGFGDGQRNIISGNLGAGISISGGTGTRFENNFVGLDMEGSSAIANGGSGVFLRAGAHDSFVSDNFVAGNLRSQISLVAAGTTGNTIRANFVGFGTDMLRVEGGTAAILISADGNTIGGETAADGNVISGSNVGISLNGVAARYNLIQNNLIGTDELGNDFGMGSGIQLLQGAHNNDIVENTIAFSTGDAIRSPSGGEGNTFSRNNLNSNQFGIDLGGNGANVNDAGDTDTGPNQLRNTPIVSDVLVDMTSATTANITISYSVDTDPNDGGYPLTIEFFLSNAAGADAFFIGSDTFSPADYATGIKSITLVGVSVAGLSLDALVATSTDRDGNSSELSTPASITVG